MIPPESYRDVYRKYEHLVLPIRLRVKQRLRELFEEAMDHDSAELALQSLPPLTYSLLTYFPIFAAEGKVTGENVVLELSEANHYLSVCNWVLDDVLDSAGRSSRATMLPLTYVLFLRATSHFDNALASLDRDSSVISLAITENMAALTRETHPTARKHLTCYKIVGQDCSVLKISWRLLCTHADEALITKFLEAHKMFDDLVDFQEDVKTGAFSLLISEAENELRTSRESVNISALLSTHALDRHCLKLLDLLRGCSEEFKRLGLVSLSSLSDIRHRDTASRYEGICALRAVTDMALFTEQPQGSSTLLARG